MAYDGISCMGGSCPLFMRLYTMLQHSRDLLLQVHGDRSTHYGLFGGCGSDATAQPQDPQQAGSCC